MQRVMLIGDPVAHSRSPAMHNAAFRHLALDLRYEAWATPAAELAQRIAMLREPAWRGANVTLPHKAAVVSLLDALETDAAYIGAVNTIYKRADETLVGANTDAPGLLVDLRQRGQFDPAAKVAVVLGASGAARAAVYALMVAGAKHIVVANRTLARAEELLADLLVATTDDYGRSTTGTPAPQLTALALDDDDCTDSIATCDLLINATSLGWHGDETPLPDPPVGPQTLVYDMVYRSTQLVRDATERGASTLDGSGMLVQQGALAFTRWTEREAPLDVMIAAFSHA